MNNFWNELALRAPITIVTAILSFFVYIALDYSWRQWLRRRLRRRRQGDAMIFPSEFSRRQFPGLSMLPYRVISNGVDPFRFRATAPDAFIRKFSPADAKLRLLFVGRLHREKSVEALPADDRHVLAPAARHHVRQVARAAPEAGVEGRRQRRAFLAGAVGSARGVRVEAVPVSLDDLDELEKWCSLGPPV